MNVIIIDNEKYIFFEGDIPEIKDKLGEISELIESLTTNKNESTIVEKYNKPMIRLETVDSEVMISSEEIVSIEVYRNNCTVYTVGSVYKLKRGALENILKGINDKHIVRCHKSYGINVRWLEGWKKKERNLWEPIYRENIEAPCLISKTYYDEVQTAHMHFHHGDKSVKLQK